jgi:hypothetical protein
VFENNHYNIYAAEMPAQLTGAQAAAADRDAAVLPPYNRSGGDIARLLETPMAGLPPVKAYPQSEYHPHLSLDQIGQPTVGVGADRFGAYAAGGISMMWSDMLGNHTLGTTVQLTSRFQEIGGAVGYLNQKSRWNWGMVGEQTPYVTGSFSQGLANVNGGTAVVEQTYRVTQINRAFTGIAQYPFSRAQRLEFAAGGRRISFDQQIDTDVFSPITGERIDHQVQELPRPGALNLGESSAALVYDSSIFGATGPIIGQRYRFELSQVAGSLTYSGLLFDFRRYVMPVRPFTFAFRGLHYGRYGSGGEDTRLSPLYLGYPGLVRGYEVGSFDASECESVATCKAFDQLVGSRMAIGNAEIRFPLYGLFSRKSMYGPLPLEIAFFGDSGIAWTSSGRPAFLSGGNREWVKSVGTAFRLNAFGYAIAELDFVKPLDRPQRGWMWQFNLTPGF